MQVHLQPVERRQWPRSRDEEARRRRHRPHCARLGLKPPAGPAFRGESAACSKPPQSERAERRAQRRSARRRDGRVDRRRLRLPARGRPHPRQRGLRLARGAARPPGDRADTGRRAADGGVARGLADASRPATARRPHGSRAGRCAHPLIATVPLLVVVLALAKPLSHVLHIDSVGDRRARPAVALDRARLPARDGRAAGAAALLRPRRRCTSSRGSSASSCSAIAAAAGYRLGGAVARDARRRASQPRRSRSLLIREPLRGAETLPRAELVTFLRYLWPVAVGLDRHRAAHERRHPHRQGALLRRRGRRLRGRLGVRARRLLPAGDDPHRALPAHRRAPGARRGDGGHPRPLAARDRRVLRPARARLRRCRRRARLDDVRRRLRGGRRGARARSRSRSGSSRSRTCSSATTSRAARRATPGSSPAPSSCRSSRSSMIPSSLERRRLDERRRRRPAARRARARSSGRACRRSARRCGASPRRRGRASARVAVETVLVLLGTTLFVCVLMWPVVQHLGSTIIGSPGLRLDGLGLVPLDAAARERLPPARHDAPHAQRRAVRLGRRQRAQHPVVAAVLPGVSRDAAVRPGRRVQPDHARRLHPLRRVDVPAGAVPRLQPPRRRRGPRSSSSSSPGTSRAPSTPR